MATQERFKESIKSTTKTRIAIVNFENFFKVNLLFVTFDRPETYYPPPDLTYCNAWGTYMCWLDMKYLPIRCESDFHKSGYK